MEEGGVGIGFPGGFFLHTWSPLTCKGTVCLKMDSRAPGRGHQAISHRKLTRVYFTLKSHRKL